MKTLYRIYEFLFDRWKWELVEKGRITKHIYFHKDKIPHKITQTFIYKLTNKFDGSIKYKSKIIEI